MNFAKNIENIGKKEIFSGGREQSGFLEGKKFRERSKSMEGIYLQNGDRPGGRQSAAEPER
ncbi:MAG: hypothetical protein E7042_01410 [Lentisphaerae bacterium]|nr:hypothetical protein [Lentisphaerota bacterium]